MFIVENTISAKALLFGPKVFPKCHTFENDFYFKSVLKKSSIAYRVLSGPLGTGSQGLFVYRLPEAADHTRLASLKSQP